MNLVELKVMVASREVPRARSPYDSEDSSEDEGAIADGLAALTKASVIEEVTVTVTVDGNGHKDSDLERFAATPRMRSNVAFIMPAKRMWYKLGDSTTKDLSEAAVAKSKDCVEGDEKRGGSAAWAPAFNVCPC